MLSEPSTQRPWEWAYSVHNTFKQIHGFKFQQICNAAPSFPHSPWLGILPEILLIWLICVMILLPFGSHCQKVWLPVTWLPLSNIPIPVPTTSRDNFFLSSPTLYCRFGRRVLKCSWSKGSIRTLTEFLPYPNEQIHADSQNSVGWFMNQHPELILLCQTFNFCHRGSSSSRQEGSDYGRFGLANTNTNMERTSNTSPRNTFWKLYSHHCIYIR